MTGFICLIMQRNRQRVLIGLGFSIIC